MVSSSSRNRRRHGGGSLWVGGGGISLLLVAIGVSFWTVVTPNHGLSHYLRQITPTTRSNDLDDGKTSTAEQHEHENEHEREKSLEYYRENYKYQPPDNTSVVKLPPRATNVCGDPPSFDGYFAQPKFYRSQFGEDYVLNQRLFQPYYQQQNARNDDSNGNEDHHRPLNNFSFVELGAFDGVQWSNTRFLEECLGWNRGVLMEASPGVYSRLLSNRPRAHRLSLAPSCPAQGSNMTMTANARPGSRRVENEDVVPDKNNSTDDTTTETTVPNDQQNIVTVPCGPLAPILHDLLGGHVTFFSLDVEGSEMNVLRTLYGDNEDDDSIPLSRRENHDNNSLHDGTTAEQGKNDDSFEKKKTPQSFSSSKRTVHVDIWMIESWRSNKGNSEDRSKQQVEDVRRLLTRQGYRHYDSITQHSDLFIHPLSPFQL